MECKTIDLKSIKDLKQVYELDLAWYILSDDEVVYGFFEDNKIIAFVKISENSIEEGTIDIDEFEVLSLYRGKGYGKKCIDYLLKELNTEVKLLAQNSEVQKFWESCGFVDDGISEEELPLIYRPKNQKGMESTGVSPHKEKINISKEIINKTR